MKTTPSLHQRDGRALDVELVWVQKQSSLPLRSSGTECSSGAECETAIPSFSINSTVERRIHQDEIQPTSFDNIEASSKVPIISGKTSCSKWLNLAFSPEDQHFLCAVSQCDGNNRGDMRSLRWQVCGHLSSHRPTPRGYETSDRWLLLSSYRDENGPMTGCII